MTALHHASAEREHAAGAGRPELLAALCADLAGLTPSRPPIPGFSEADAEKVAPHVLAWGAAAGELDDAEQARYDRILRKRALLAEEAAAISAIARDLDVRHLFVRGFAFQPHYPPGYFRQFNDLDLAVGSEDELARLLRELRSRGYYLSRAAVMRRNLSGCGGRRWYGLSLNRRDPRLDEPLILDLYLGGPSITSQTHCCFPQPLFDHPWWAAVGGAAIPIPDPTWSLICLLAEWFERDRLVLRDLLDLDRLMSADVDWARLSVEVGRLRLAGQEARAADALARRPDSPSRAARLRREHLLGRVFAESPLRAPARLGFLLAQPGFEWLERHRPDLAIGLVRRVDARVAEAIGLSLYLFEETTGAAGRDRIALLGRRWRARLRPLVYEDEVPEGMRP